MFCNKSRVPPPPSVFWKFRECTLFLVTSGFNFWFQLIYLSLSFFFLNNVYIEIYSLHHTIHPFKECSTVVWGYSHRDTQLSPLSILEHCFHHPPLPLPYPLAVIPHPPPQSSSLRQAFWLWIWLFRTFPINGIIKYVSFHDWLLSLSIMFSKFILLACRSTSFF